MLQLSVFLNSIFFKKEVYAKKIWFVSVTSAAIMTKSPTDALIIIACCLL